MEKYRVVVDPQSAASRTLSQLQPPVRKEFWRKMDEICSDVPGHSKWTLHAGRREQVFQFKIPVEGTWFYCTVTFRFADTRDESTLLVTGILVREI